MKNKNHSPLPWYSIAEGKSDSGLYVSSARFDGVTIAICKATTQDVADANISLIVEAVNHHEELKASVESFCSATSYEQLILLKAEARLLLEKLDGKE